MRILNTVQGIELKHALEEQFGKIPYIWFSNWQMLYIAIKAIRQIRK